MATQSRTERRASARGAGPDVTRPRDLEGDYRKREQRKQARAARGEAPRSEEATSIDEALEAEYEAGRKAGARTPAPTRARPPAPASASVTSRAVNVSQFSGGGNAGVTVPMLFEFGIITVDEVTNNGRLPIPSRLLVTFLVFGGLGLAKNTSAARAASAFAWGIVVATFYTTSTGGSGGIAFLNVLGGFFGGKIGAKGTSLKTGAPSVSAPTAGAFTPGSARSFGGIKIA